MAPLNPVLRRELKERMRSRVTGFVLTLYLGVLALVLYGLYSNAQHQQFGGIDPLATANVGRGMFESLLFAVLLLVCFLVPGYTASAVVGERERETLIPMQVTLLSPRSIIFGKLLASLAYLSLLVVATIPLLAASFLFGGVTPTEMLKGIGMVMATGVLLASLSLLVSTMSRRVQTATVLAYGLTVMLVLGTFAIYGFEVIVSNHQGVHNKAILAINPLVATADAVAARSGGDLSPSSPLTSMRNLLRGNNNFQTFSNSAGAVAVPGGGIVVRGGPISINGGNGFNPLVAQSPPSLPPYAAYALGFFALVSAVALGLAMRRITTPRRTTRT
jgi:ABC-type transport system involved in multi-copper enzyme maturation permease subunit